MVMVSPGTHLVKNHESLSIANKSQLKKTRVRAVPQSFPLTAASRLLSFNWRT